MISRTSTATSFRISSMGSSGFQTCRTWPSVLTRNFQKFHFGIRWAESVWWDVSTDTFSSRQQLHVGTLDVSFTCEEFKRRFCFRSHNFDLVKEREGYAVVGSGKGFGLAAGAGFCLSVLWAWKRQHGEMSRAQVTVKLLEIAVILLGLLTVTRHIYYQRNLKPRHTRKGKTGLVGSFQVCFKEDVESIATISLSHTKSLLAPSRRICLKAPPSLWHMPGRFYANSLTVMSQ